MSFFDVIFGRNVLKNAADRNDSPGFIKFRKAGRPHVAHSTIRAPDPQSELEGFRRCDTTFNCGINFWSVFGKVRRQGRFQIRPPAFWLQTMQQINELGPEDGIGRKIESPVSKLCQPFCDLQQTGTIFGVWRSSSLNCFLLNRL
nr:hypothetical protein [Nisaea denitrificans]